MLSRGEMHFGITSGEWELLKAFPDPSSQENARQDDSRGVRCKDPAFQYTGFA